MKDSVKLGYTVDVLEGYHYQHRGNIFKSYVYTLYKDRMKYDKSNPLNFIMKLLLNSLYGRFALSPHMSEVISSASKFTQAYLDEGKLSNIINLGGNNLFFFDNERNLSFTSTSGTHDILQISLPISMFTTAYARSHMNKFLVKYSDHLVYTDTDSIFLTKPLPKKYIGGPTGEIGKFKLEYFASEGVFSLRTSPKVYSLLLSDGTKVTKIKGSNIKPSFADLKSLALSPQGRHN